MLQRFFSPRTYKAQRQAALQLYRTIVAQSRLPDLYQKYAIPDTVDGRFDCLVLHMALVIMRLQDAGRQGALLSQHLFDVMFRDMDLNLREMGVGDMSIGKHFRRMSRAFNGRVRAYEDALRQEGNDLLGQTLEKNLYRKTDNGKITEMADYMRAQMRFLTGQGLENILAGKLEFSSVSE